MVVMRYSVAIVQQPRPPAYAGTVCSASPSIVTADQLRKQLDNLHKEADTTRTRANSARLRLIRLSEAAENLRRRAAVDALTGKENDARELLFQKKKIMGAMEKLKNRIEVLDELSAKLNEAISMKEDMLIDSAALDLEDSATENPSPIRIVSPKETDQNTSDDNQELDLNFQTSGANQWSKILDENAADTLAEDKENGLEVSLSKEIWNGEDHVQSPRGTYSYRDFMKNLDQQLNEIEKELEKFARFSFFHERKEKPKYSQLQSVMEILEGVHQIRERIVTTLETQTEEPS